MENASFQGRQPSGQRGTIPTAKRQIWVYIAPTLSEIKSLYEEKDGISYRGVTWQDPVLLKTIITLFEKAGIPRGDRGADVVSE